MSQSRLLRSQDVRALYELANECRERGDDADAWRRHWFAGLGRLTGADLVVGGEKTWLRDGGGETLGVADWGFEAGFDRAVWGRAVAAFDENATYSPVEVAYMKRSENGAPGTALARTDLLTDRQWYPSADYEVICRQVGVDHLIRCYQAVGPAAAEAYNAVIVSRAVGRKDFTAREKAIVRESHALLAPLVGGALARFGEPSPAALSPRLRQVLRCILEGDGDKQIAARLTISAHTVNQYIKLIFQHFGVQSRAELMARWVRRGWAGGFAWAEE
jgi:DNA-binding CsgD family transcriptional regulator